MLYNIKLIWFILFFWRNCNLDNKKGENIEQIPELNLKEKNLFYKTYKEYDSEDSYISKDSNSEEKENLEIEE